jgi:hypothetical protein
MHCNIFVTRDLCVQQWLLLECITGYLREGKKLLFKPCEKKRIIEFQSGNMLLLVGNCVQ